MAETKPKTTRRASTKRAQNTKELTQEAMRQKISFTKTLTAIEKNEAELSKLAKGAKDPSAARVGAIKALQDSHWKKMDRLLPALKAVEITGEMNHGIGFFLNHIRPEK